ncbi:E3 ubiquitin-protein ligase ubr1, partial [Linderina macrospora]
MVNVSLSISIRAARDVFREQLSASLLIWLRDLACCKFRPLARVFQGKVNNEIRSEISHQLCLRWEAPFRNNYLADLLFKQYSYDVRPVDSDNEDAYVDGDLDDEEYLDDDEEEEEEEEGSVEDDGAITQDESKATQQITGPAVGYHHAHTAAAAAAAAAQEIGMVVDPPEAPDVQIRGRRRLRSDSTDSLRQQGEERGSPRNYPQSGAVRGRDSGDTGAPPPSLWLSETAGGNSVPSFQSAVGAAVDAVGAAGSRLAQMMQPNYTPGNPQHSMAPGAFPSTTYISEDPTADQTHWRMATQIENAPQQDPDQAYDQATFQAIKRVLRGCGQQRLDWFLIFDLQLWKEVRSGLRELYMATLMLDGRYKIKIALTFSRNYPRLSRAFLMQDRAPEHSVLLFSVQLFTAPTLSAELVDHHRFLYIILSVLKRFFVEPTPVFLRHQGVVLCDTESFRNRRYFHVFHDMRYLAGTPQVRNWVSSQHQFLATYVGFIGLFQGMNPNRRAVLQHVEYEADTWVNAFNVTLQVAKSCRQFAECYGISARDLFFAMRGTLRALRHSVALMAEENCAVIIRTAQIHGLLGPEAGHTVNTGGNLGDALQLVAEAHIRSTMWGKQYYIVKYDVASCPVSFHHPLHWFMAELCQHVKLLSEDIAREYGFDSIQHMIFTAFNLSYDSALEVPQDAAMDGS